MFKLQMEKSGDITTKREDVTGTPTQLFRKECRINGTVGNTQKRDRLTYGSLTHQVKAANLEGIQGDQGSGRCSYIRW